MDAFTQNKCEAAFLSIITYISKEYSISVEIETVPPIAGSLRRRYIIKEKKKHSRFHDSNIKQTDSEKSSKKILKTAILSALVTIPITIATNVVSGLFLDTITKKGNEQVSKDGFENIEIKQRLNKVYFTPTISKKREIFYKSLYDDFEVNAVGISIFTENELTVIQEQSIKRDQFAELIVLAKQSLPSIELKLETEEYINAISVNKLQPSKLIEEENVIIEVISPALKRNHKWIGIWNGKEICFDLDDRDFCSLVQRGKVNFRDNFYIKGKLKILKHRKKNLTDYHYHLSKVRQCDSYGIEILK